MSIKVLLVTLMMTTLFQSVFAEPSYEVMKSCQKGEPVNSTLTISPLDGPSGYPKNSPAGCDERYEIKYKDGAVGTMVCGDNLYIYSGQRRIKAADATDMTGAPGVKPNTLYPSDADWSRIDKGNESYLCIDSPLSQSGANAARSVYYIIEGAFDDRSPLRAYFYYFGDRK